MCANGLKVLNIPNRVTGQNSFHLENKDDDFEVVTHYLFKNDTTKKYCIKSPTEEER